MIGHIKFSDLVPYRTRNKRKFQYLSEIARVTHNISSKQQHRIVSMHVGCTYKYICGFNRSVSCATTKLKSMTKVDCIWQMRFKLSRVAEAHFNTRMTEIPPLLDVFLYHAFKRHVLTFLSTEH